MYEIVDDEIIEQVDGRFGERTIWEALLKQAEANLAISNGALLRQAEANLAISKAILATPSA